jgi:hypothetical protein
MTSSPAARKIAPEPTAIGPSAPVRATRQRERPVARSTAESAEDFAFR